MPFSRRFTICVTHRSPKSLSQQAENLSLSWYSVTFDIDLKMVLTLWVSFNEIQGYRSNTQAKYVIIKFDIDL